jgi:hypothetical protein
MVGHIVLAAFAITTLAVVFCAVPIYCVLRSADLFSRLDRRASDNGRIEPAQLSSRQTLRDVIEADRVLQLPARRVSNQTDRAMLTEERVDQLAS